MTYSIFVSKENTPTEFNGLLRIINKVTEEQYNKRSTAEIVEFIKTNYGMQIHAFTKNDAGEAGHTVDFISEKDYIIFMLKWT